MTTHTDYSERKRAELQEYIRRELALHAAVRAVVAIGSVAAGTAAEGSDIDALLFLDPLDLFVAPAEFIWRPEDNSYHSIFRDVAGVQLDFTRLPMALLRDEANTWPEGRLHELAHGWLAFDRDGEAARLIAARTRYPDERRQAVLDEAITWLDQHLEVGVAEEHWQRLGPLVAHDRLSAAYDYLAQALFALNRVWRPWRNREMGYVLALDWLPANFETLARAAIAPEKAGWAGYTERVAALRQLFGALTTQAQTLGVYGADPIDEAFIRSHEEPGRAWNMAAWYDEHNKRYPTKETR
jgi:hypothetical protein